MPTFKIGGINKSSQGGSIRIPALRIQLPDESKMALDAIKETKRVIEQNLKTGKDAQGQSHKLSPATVARRARRPGSRGGGQPFVDTGRLAQGLRVTQRRDGASLEVPADRLEAAERLEKMSRPVVAALPEPMDRVLKKVMDKAIR